MGNRQPPIPLDPRDKAIDALIDDKNRLYAEVKKLQNEMYKLNAQKKLLKSRLKFLQEKYSDRSNQTYNEANYKKRSKDSN